MARLGACVQKDVVPKQGIVLSKTGCHDSYWVFHHPHQSTNVRLVSTSAALYFSIPMPGTRRDEAQSKRVEFPKHRIHLLKLLRRKLRNANAQLMRFKNYRFLSYTINR